MYVDLLRAEDVPVEHREPGILSGYRRCPSSLRTCIFSVFHCSNETVNFWTHFIPALFFLHKSSFHFDLDERPFVAYIFSVTVFLMTSSLAHAFWPLSNIGRDLCFFLDYAALNFYAFGTAMGFWAYFFSPGFYAAGVGRYYVYIAGILCPLCTLVACLSRFASRHMTRKMSRLGGFATLYLWTTMPLLFDLLKSGRFAALSWEIFHVALLAVGVAIYALHWPERWFPGRFDVLGNSHNLLHVFGSAAVYVQYSTLTTQKTRRLVGSEGLDPSELGNFANQLSFAIPFILATDAVILAVCTKFKSTRSFCRDAEEEDRDKSD